MINRELGRIFYETAVLLEMEGVTFKPRAYEKASQAIASLAEDVAEIYRRGGLKELEQIPEVGRGIAEKIEEYISTGRIKEYAKLKKKTPVDIADLRSVEGLGPKKIRMFWQKLKIRTLADLEEAARRGRIRRLPNLGAKTEENILKSIEFVKKTGGRFLLGEIYSLVKGIEERLCRLKEVKRVVIAGSIRRMKETVGDADILAISSRPKPVMDFFTNLEEVVRVYARGETKSMVKLGNGLDVDLRVVPEESFGAALSYFTGSKNHNVALRQIALRRGMKLNEYGLFRGKKPIAGRTEEEVYQALRLDYIEPELRENTGEIEAAQKRRLPNLIGYRDLLGDLQIQTNWTDGANSIQEMAAAAQKHRLEYICITDHTKTLAMTGGCDERKLLRQMKEIDKINQRLSGITVLKGAEVNILPDGSLDIADEVLAKLDCVGAAVHSHFKMSKEAMTRRIVRAMENPQVDIIFHPTGRIIGRREAYELDLDEIIKAAKRTKTILEINASPERLDLKDEHIRRCVSAGVKLSLSSDAHNVGGYEFLKFGLAQARRGWAAKKNIVNALPLKEFLLSLKGRGVFSNQ